MPSKFGIKSFCRNQAGWVGTPMVFETWNV
jgi:hypothetical protein